MQVHCSKGTYVRTLVEDLGALLNCGAHVVELRRTSLGSFINPSMVTLSDLDNLAGEDFSQLDQLLLPIEKALQEWPVIQVTPQQMLDIQHGRSFQLPELEKTRCARIYAANEQFYGMARYNQQGKIVVKCLSECI